MQGVFAEECDARRGIGSAACGAVRIIPVGRLMVAFFSKRGRNPTLAHDMSGFTEGFQKKSRVQADLV